MANSSSGYEVAVPIYTGTSAIDWTTEYLKKLLIERHNIRAAIENPGGSIIAGGAAQAADADQLPSYSSVVGNDSHLDLLEAELEVNRLDVQDRIELLAWCDGLSPKQAAQWANLRGGKVRSHKAGAARKRMQRTVQAVTAKANDNEDT